MVIFNFTQTKSLAIASLVYVDKLINLYSVSISGFLDGEAQDGGGRVRAHVVASLANNDEQKFLVVIEQSIVELTMVISNKASI